MQSPERPRVLHVLGSLNRGGVETWLLHVLRNTPEEQWSTEFLLHRITPGAYDEEARALGAVLRYCPGPRHPLGYTRRLQRILAAYGPYDVVHSHVHFYSGVVLRAAAHAGVPVRIAHSHTTQLPPGRAYGALMRHWIHQYATHGLAAGSAAARVLFGEDWRADPRIQLHDYGIDFTRFAGLPSRSTLKVQLGLPAERIVVGHVGRFAHQKNHSFLVSVFAELLKQGVDAQLLLVGTGPLEPVVREQVAALGLQERCTFAGAHNDIGAFYGAMDLMVFPSHWEGFGVVTLEAQAAGVPVLASEAVPRAASVVPDLLHYLPLAAGPIEWAAVARRILAKPPALAGKSNVDLLAYSRYGIERSVDELAALYCGAHTKSGGRAEARVLV